MAKLARKEGGHSCPPNGGLEKSPSVCALPDDWQVKPLSAVAHGFLSGGTPSTKNETYWQGSVPWITSKWIKSRLYLDNGEKFISDDAVRQSATTVVPRNNLIFATRVGVGKVAVNRLDLAINQDLAGVLIDSDRCDIRFIAYQLRSGRIQNVVASHKRGATIQGITRDNLKELEINLPPLAEQRKIAGVLGVVQRAMEQQERLIALTTELKKALLHQLFTQGLQGEPQKQTEIGPVPESWVVSPAGSIAELKSGGTPSRSEKKYWVGGTIPWVKTSEVDYCTINDTEEKITSDGLANSSAKLFSVGTLLMAMYGQGITRGKVAILGVQAATNQACAAFFPNEQLRSKFLYYFFESQYKNLRKLGHGANQKNLSADILKTAMVAYPVDTSEQEEIIRILEEADRKIQLISKKKSVLSDLFRTLLHQLMTAQLRVHDHDLLELETTTQG
ncbi:restriction endonuclease subunit S [bacterium]|nr:MAG: restriction endonuclease subunit S [bacterium]